MRTFDMPLDLEEREGFWDIHSHILPGIDDGAKDWETSLEMIRRAWESGVRTIIATPHYLPWRREAYEPEQVFALCLEARERARTELDLDMVILPGQELYYYSGLVEDLQEEQCLTLAGTRTILVEFAEGEGSFSELRGALSDLSRAGYQVILAHAERYMSLRKKGRLEELIDEGVYIQSNLQEISGGLTDPLARWVRKQYSLGNIHFTASDMHDLVRRPPFSQEDLNRLARRAGGDYMEDLLGGNIRDLLFYD